MKTGPVAYLLALASLVAGRRLDWEGEALDAPNSVFVTWESSLNTGDQIIFVKDNEGTSLLAYACDSKVTFGGVPIQVFADDTGSGELTIGDARYALEFDAERSGGIVCEARWNTDVAAVECEVPWAAGELDTHERLPLNITAECLGPESDNDLAIIGTFYEDELFVFPTDSSVEEADGLLDEGHDGDSEALERRQGPVCQARRSIKKKGNGNPRKWRRHQQLTGRVECGKGPCEMSHSKEYSVTHQAGFSLTGGGSGDWISAGYSVSWTRGTTETATCGSEKNYQTICVANWRRYQEYTVERETWSSCKPNDKKKTTYNIWSPLTANSQTAYYCKRGGCGGNGDVSWEDRGKGVHGSA